MEIKIKQSHHSQGRGRWILTLVPSRYEASASIMKKSFLQKSFVEELAGVWLICTCHVTVHMWPIREFGTHG
jgi:hypothetical protein